MSRNKHTLEQSVPHMRGHKSFMKGKRLSHKRMRRLPLDASPEELQLASKSVELDTDPVKPYQPWK